MCFPWLHAQRAKSWVCCGAPACGGTAGPRAGHGASGKTRLRFSVPHSNTSIYPADTPAAHGGRGHGALPSPATARGRHRLSPAGPRRGFNRTQGRRLLRHPRGTEPGRASPVPPEPAPQGPLLSRRPGPTLSCQAESLRSALPHTEPRPAAPPLATAWCCECGGSSRRRPPLIPIHRDPPGSCTGIRPAGPEPARPRREQPITARNRDT